MAFYSLLPINAVKITSSTRNQEIRALTCQILSLIKIIVQSISVRNIAKQVPLGLISNVSGAALDMEMTKPDLPGRVCANVLTDVQLNWFVS